MIRYEASLGGGPVIGEPFTNFDELKVLENIFESLNWHHNLVFTGRGGYYFFEVEQADKKTIKLHVYLKRITFGGRESRPYEKRAQFSAALDRAGFIIQETQEEYSVILGIYKNDKFPDVVLCAWDVHDWGNNVGRAFNCFVDVMKINQALNGNEIVQHRTSIGQIACCFKPEYLPAYLSKKEELHKNLNKYNYQIPQSHIIAEEPTVNYASEIPNFTNLFQLIIDILKNHNGIANVDTIELEAAEILKLEETARFKIHNESEGYRTELGYQLAWARFYLKKSALVESPKRSIWALTGVGWNIMEIDRDAIIKAATQKEIQDEMDTDTLQYTDSENDIENEADLENAFIENPFDPNQVDIRTRTMSLDLILKRLRNDAIDMNTSFQRKANLWNITKQSRLIESILVRFPLPAFYFDGSNDDNWLVVDGLQRLSSLDNYVNKEIFGLQNLEFLSQFNGKNFTELPGYLQRRIEEFEITAYLIASGTPKVLKFNVFKRINTGGLMLTAQEIRNALNQGKPAQFVKQLSDLRSFKMATSFTIPEDRMLDQEFVTRFLAFYLLNIDEYNADLDGFLNRGMDELNKVEDTEKIEKDFDKAMNAAILIFGNDAFRKRFSRKDKRKPINKALFEVWAVILSKLSEQNIIILVQNKNALIDSFITLLNNDDNFNRSITSATGDKTRVKKRFSEINNIIQSVINQ
jgi:Protein of unknown function DUF262/Mrr N-terminal domain